MTIPKRAVEVRVLPAKLSGKQGGISLCEIQNCLNVDRPRLALDCSNLRQLDRPVIHLLLCCLEEALKRNGDVKLAALPASARAALKAAGAGRLFEIHDTVADAVNSFHNFPAATLRFDDESKRTA